MGAREVDPFSAKSGIRMVRGWDSSELFILGVRGKAHCLTILLFSKGYLVLNDFENPGDFLKALSFLRKWKIPYFKYVSIL